LSHSKWTEVELRRCNIAGNNLVELAPYSDKVVPGLTALLTRSKSEYIRRVAASCLGRIGARAKTALPALKAGRADPDPNIRSAFKDAVGQIEKARDEPGWREEFEKRLAIVKDLDEWKKGRTK
jgi:HEAT repeat protein